MSGFQTHMLIGAVGGLALARGLALVGLSPALGLDPALGGAGSGVAALVSSGLPLAALSALLATVPDIDEPGSFSARRARAVLTLVGAGLAGYAAVAGHLAPVFWGVAAAVGLLVGQLGGMLLLRLIRRGAGGHRRLTHSLVLAFVLGLAAGGLWLAQFGAWALIPAGLAWGIVLHDLGDLVTPAGLPLFYPFSGRSVRVLPEPICRVGEPLVAAAAMIVAVLLVRGG